MVDRKIGFVEEEAIAKNTAEKSNRRKFLHTLSALGTGMAIGNVLAPLSVEAEENKSILPPPEGEFITTVRELENLLRAILPTVYDDFAKQADATEILRDAIRDPKAVALPENGEVFLASVEDFASRRIGFRSPGDNNRFYNEPKSHI
jgi:hypothetical protein